ncbi:hypothetical protein KSP39_PZI016016 [Platanthera zijinensis]|uniref:Transmembrane protein n=1 Tax=Platanthera zijinensis TaxID=2320716 RepID=A0AAP0B8J6_9ASPA
MSPSCCCGGSLSFLGKPLLSSEPSGELIERSFLGRPLTRSRPGTHSTEKIRRRSAIISVVSSNSRVLCGILPTDPWSPTVDSQSIASQLFAVSLFPYIGFLYYITRSKTAPRLTLFGFYFLLAFVGATTLTFCCSCTDGFLFIHPVPAGIYGKLFLSAKLQYGTSLANVDWLHGGAESLLALTNLFIVLGLRRALRKINDLKKATDKSASDISEEQSSV